MAQPVTAIDDAFRALDSLRVRAFKRLGPWIKPVIRRRELRVALFGVSVVVLAMAATLLCPFWLLALGPILWGVPHLVSDLRYLVFKPGWHRQRGFWLAVGAPLAVAGTGWHPMEFGLLASGGAALIATGAWTRKVVMMFLVTGLLALVFWLGSLSQLIFAHLNNFIAVLLWWRWRPRTHWMSATVPILFLLGSLALFLGWAWPFGIAASGPASLTAQDYLNSMAPGLAEPWALRLVLLFAFAQSVHYGVWLRLIPEDDRPQPTLRPFTATFRVLKQDMGGAALVIASVLAIALAVWAVFDLAEARTGYLRAALFHGYLELAACALLFVQRPPRIPV